MKKHILVIDDDIMLAEIISHCLTENGYTVTTTNSGDEAFSFFTIHRFDLVLCDIHMEGRDGFAVLAACKAIHPETKVILCSGDVVYTTISRAFKSGADSFLAKPFLPSELLYQVGRCLGRAQQELPGQIPQHTHAAQVAGTA